MCVTFRKKKHFKAIFNLNQAVLEKPYKDVFSDPANGRILEAFTFFEENGVYLITIMTKWFMIQIHRALSCPNCC